VIVIVEPHTILDTEPRMGAGEARFCGDVGEDDEDQFVWEFENCERG